MSLFSSMMGDFDEDLLFGPHMSSMRHMNSMMNSFFTDPFGLTGQNALTDAHHVGGRRNELQMIPFGFPPMPSMNLDRIFANFDNMTNNANCHSFSRSSVMTMASGPDGRPQVYQETMSTRTAPGGVKETKKTVCDSRTGTKKMAIGHHIGDRAHILEREHNLHNGEQEERQEFINLDEEEAESFNNEWELYTRRPAAIGRSSYSGRHNRARPDHKQLALPDPSTSQRANNSRWMASPRCSIKALPPNVCGLSSNSRSGGDLGHTDSSKTKVPSTSGNRKREHTPDIKATIKRPAVSDSDI